MAGEITVFRICKTKYVGTAFDGEGAFRSGGRWNSPGTRIIYCGGSLSLATLEMLVHLDDDALLLAYSYIPAHIPDNLILPVEDIADLPKDWNTSPAPLAIQQIGDDWAAKGASAVLQVPTSIIPLENNYLLNPAHSDFGQIRIGDIKNFSFDERFAKK